MSITLFRKDIIANLASEATYDPNTNLISQLTHLVDNITEQVIDTESIEEKKIEAKRNDKILNLIDLRKVTLQEINDEMIEALKAITMYMLQKVSDPSLSTNDLEKTIQKYQQELQQMKNSFNAMTYSTTKQVTKTQAKLQLIQRVKAEQGKKTLNLSQIQIIQSPLIGIIEGHIKDVEALIAKPLDGIEEHLVNI